MEQENKLEDYDICRECGGKCCIKCGCDYSALDFDDLIMKTTQLLLDNPEVLAYYQNKFKYILVDEYQDTNTAQFTLVSLLASGYGNLCVVGDDDQSIYGWRGADMRNILEFEKAFPGAKTIKLEQNYRSTGNILNAANEIAVAAFLEERIKFTDIPTLALSAMQKVDFINSPIYEDYVETDKITRIYTKELIKNL